MAPLDLWAMLEGLVFDQLGKSLVPAPSEASTDTEAATNFGTLNMNMPEVLAETHCADVMGLRVSIPGAMPRRSKLEANWLILTHQM